MCFEIAGSVISKGSASSLTVAEPSARRARIARRVELASAANVSLSRSSSITMVMVSPPYFPSWIINLFGKYSALRRLSIASGQCVSIAGIDMGAVP